MVEDGLCCGDKGYITASVRFVSVCMWCECREIVEGHVYVWERVYATKGFVGGCGSGRDVSDRLDCLCRCVKRCLS